MSKFALFLAAIALFIGIYSAITAQWIAVGGAFIALITFVTRREDF